MSKLFNMMLFVAIGLTACTNDDSIENVIVQEELCDARSAANPWYRPIYETTYYAKIEPRIKVKWGQKGIMGYYCSNGSSGCANTAAAQIMSYYQHPASLTLTYSGKDVNSTALNWNTMTDDGKDKYNFYNDVMYFAVWRYFFMFVIE